MYARGERDSERDGRVLPRLRETASPSLPGGLHPQRVRGSDERGDRASPVPLRGHRQDQASPSPHHAQRRAPPQLPVLLQRARRAHGGAERVGPPHGAGVRLLFQLLSQLLFRRTRVRSSPNGVPAVNDTSAALSSASISATERARALTRVSTRRAVPKSSSSGFAASVTPSV